MLFQDPLPLLIKLIDAREWLSLQVHPLTIGRA
jgi:mannose-6-phosphate isomerase class I